jgi:putative flippase GtrA
MNKLKKADVLFAFLIGCVDALIIVLIARNLAVDFPVIKIALRFQYHFIVAIPLLWGAILIISYYMSRIIPVFYQFAKFIIVGSLNFLIDMGILNFLIFYTGISAGLPQSAFKGFSFIVAVLNSYLWNKFWTFRRSKSHGVRKEFIQFLIVSIIGFLLNLGIDFVFVNMIHPFGALPAKSWAQFSAMIAAIVALFWNFIGYKFIVFEVKQKGVSPVELHTRQ